jgi:hypothetical protein
VASHSAPLLLSLHLDVSAIAICKYSHMEDRDTTSWCYGLQRPRRRIRPEKPRCRLARTVSIQLPVNFDVCPSACDLMLMRRKLLLGVDARFARNTSRRYRCPDLDLVRSSTYMAGSQQDYFMPFASNGYGYWDVHASARISKSGGCSTAKSHELGHIGRHFKIQYSI